MSDPQDRYGRDDVVDRSSAVGVVDAPERRRNSGTLRAGVETDDATARTSAMISATIADNMLADTANAVVDGRDAEAAAPTTPTAPGRSIATCAKRCLMVGDAFALFIGVLLALGVQSLLRPVPDFGVQDQVLLFVACLPGFAFGAGCNRLYQARANERAGQEIRNVCKAVGVGVGTMLLVAVALRYKDISRLWLVIMTLSITSCWILERRVAGRIFDRLRASRRMRRRIIIVGTDAHAIGMLHRFVRRPELGYEVVGFVGDDDLGERASVGVLGTIDRLPDLLEETGANGVMVSLPSVSPEEVNRLVRELTDSGHHVALSSSLTDIDLSRIRPQGCDGQTMIYIEPVIRNGWRAVAKRVFDITLATTVLLATLPVSIAAMLAVKLTSPGPVFFVQQRVGRNGELFDIYKLRTMVVDAEARKAELADRNESDGPLFKITHDPRITPVGRILRKLSIDELPQLLCVLRGTMSMVGPRPALPSEMAEWDEEVHERLRVLPGLTGMWQVSGRSDSSFAQYKRMDLYYIDNWSLVHDLHICARTVRVVLSGRGAS